MKTDDEVRGDGYELYTELMKRDEMKASMSRQRPKPLHICGVIHFALMRNRTSEQKEVRRSERGNKWEGDEREAGKQTNRG